MLLSIQCVFVSSVPLIVCYTISTVFNNLLCSQGWSKGVVFINGKNLGRYWSIGPQQTLYVPGPWLHRGANQVLCQTHFESLYSSTVNFESFT